MHSYYVQCNAYRPLYRYYILLTISSDDLPYYRFLHKHRYNYVKHTIQMDLALWFPQGTQPQSTSWPLNGQCTKTLRTAWGKQRTVSKKEQTGLCCENKNTRHFLEDVFFRLSVSVWTSTQLEYPWMVNQYFFLVHFQFKIHERSVSVFVAPCMLWSSRQIISNLKHTNFLLSKVNLPNLLSLLHLLYMHICD